VLDRINPWGQPVRAHTAARVVAVLARDPWQVHAYFALRRAIFAEEQGIFADSDSDERDAHASPIVALSEIAGMPDRVVGVVRIYEAAENTWFGGRLGVLREYRRQGAVGSALITEAVSTAHGWGCRRFLATVQAPNVRYFERHHFRPLEAIEILGRPHALMEADLACYPPTSASSWQARAS